jgi:hypothetical protein
MDSKTYNALIERMNYLQLKKSYYNSKIKKLENKLNKLDNEIDNYKKVNNIEVNSINIKDYFISKHNSFISNQELKDFINNNKIDLSLKELKKEIINLYNAKQFTTNNIRGFKHIDFKSSVRGFKHIDFKKNNYDNNFEID